MQIIVIYHIPEEALKAALEKDGHTREDFKEFAKKELIDISADDFIPGATATIKITD